MTKIAINPQIHFGKPHIVGTRITVTDILELLNEGLSFNEILQDYYTELQEEDIKSCLEYAIALITSEEINLLSV